MKNIIILSTLSITLLVACTTGDAQQQTAQDNVQETPQEQEYTEQVIAQDILEEALAEEGEVHYICYNNDDKPSMVISIKHVDDKAVEVKYKGQKESMKLVYEKMEVIEPGYAPYAEYYTEMYNGKVNGKYKLTHSGNWDYAEYTRGKDGKVFKFTIDHEVAQYESEPCF